MSRLMKVHRGPPWVGMRRGHIFLTGCLLKACGLWGVGACPAWVTSRHQGLDKEKLKNVAGSDAGRNVPKWQKIALMLFAGRASEKGSFSRGNIATRLRR